MLGALLLAVGILLLVTCGLCTAGFAGGFLISALGSSQAENFGFVGMALLIGAPGIAVGALLFWAGKALRRQPPIPSPPTGGEGDREAGV